jgi:hypothetical protein
MNEDSKEKLDLTNTLGKKPVANHPLSKNLARILGYHQYGKKAFKTILQNKVKEIAKQNDGNTVSVQTIMSWIEADTEDPNRPRRIPFDIEKLTLLSKNLNIDDPWDLFVPSENYINLKKITNRTKRDLLKLIEIIPEEYLKGVKHYIRAHVEEDIEKIVFEKRDRLYKKELFNLLDIPLNSR